MTTPPSAAEAVVENLANVLKNGEETALLLGGPVLREEGLRAASKIAENTGATFCCEVFPIRLQRGP